MTLLAVEARRDLARWAIRLLILLALAGIVFGMVVALLASDESDPLSFPDIWSTDGSGDSALLVGSFFLPVGALFGGATVIGGEWKAGTMATLLTWEPRRVRVAVAKLGVAGVLAFLIGLVLLALFAAAFLPAIFVGGETEGADAEFWRGATGGMLRIATIASLAAVIGASLAFIGRNTALAVGATFLWVAVVEGVIRALKPDWQRWLLGENLAVFSTGAKLETETFDKSVLGAGLTLALYALVVAVIAVETFRRRDLTGAT